MLTTKLIAFLHPKGTNGVLIELCQEKPWKCYLKIGKFNPKQFAPSIKNRPFVLLIFITFFSSFDVTIISHLVLQFAPFHGIVGMAINAFLKKHEFIKNNLSNLNFIQNKSTNKFIGIRLFSGL